jgi:hypothetical protein
LTPPPGPPRAVGYSSDLAAALAGLAWGAAPPGPWGVALFLLGGALAARSLTGHLVSDALRGVLCGWCWHLVGARWVVAPLADYGVDGPEQAWASLTLVQGALVGIPWAVASLAVPRLPPTAALGLAWAGTVEALAVAQWLPVSPADLTALPPLLGPAAWGGLSLQAGVAVAVAGALPSRAGVLGLAAWAALHLTIPTGGEAVALTLIQPGTAPLDGRAGSTAPARADALRALVPAGRLALLPESAWPLPEAAPDLPGPVVLGGWSDAGQRLYAIIDGAVVDTFLKQRVTPLTEVPAAPTAAPRRLDLAGLRLGPLICYEDLVPAALREALVHDPDVLYLPANDGWTDGGRGTGWHLQHARLVAAAAGRFAARPTMTGTTALLDPAGAVVDAAPPGPVALAVTARRRHPAWTGAGASPWVAAAALLALAAAARRGVSPPAPT